MIVASRSPFWRNHVVQKDSDDDDDDDTIATEPEIHVPYDETCDFVSLGEGALRTSQVH